MIHLSPSPLRLSPSPLREGEELWTNGTAFILRPIQTSEDDLWKARGWDWVAFCVIAPTCFLRNGYDPLGVRMVIAALRGESDASDAIQ